MWDVCFFVVIFVWRSFFFFSNLLSLIFLLLLDAPRSLPPFKKSFFLFTFFPFSFYLSFLFEPAEHSKDLPDDLRRSCAEKVAMAFAKMLGDEGDAAAQDLSDNDDDTAAGDADGAHGSNSEGDAAGNDGASSPLSVS